MVKHIVIPLIMIMIGTNGYGEELGQNCRYTRTIDVDKNGNTSGVQTYTCKTEPREVINRTETVHVKTCASKLLFGFDCDPDQPEGDGFAKLFSTLVSIGVIQ
jgi:hypothetical protein